MRIDRAGAETVHGTGQLIAETAAPSLRDAAPPARVAVIGLDCAPPALIFERWRDVLPNLTALRARGVWGALRSCHPPITVPAWAVLTTGRDPGQLGLYGFAGRRSYAYGDAGLVNSTDVGSARIWDILSGAGRRVIVLGVPPTYPPRPVNGVMVSCFLTPSAQSAYTYPDALRAEVEAVTGGYVFDVDDFRNADPQAVLDRLYAAMRQHFGLARHLLATRPWDFFMMVEMGLDRLHHAFWQHCDPNHPRYAAGHPFERAMVDFYREVDREVGELLAAIGPQALVLVVSDHGAKRMEGGVCLNEWLRRRGDLVLHRCPDRIAPLTADLVDWSATRAWGEGGYCGRIFLNVKGREPRGIVEPRDYEALRDELIAAVAALRGPDGRSLGSHAHRPQALYRETNGVPPDLLVYFGDLRWRALGSVGHAEIFAADNDEGPDGANHDWDGIFIMSGGGCTGGGRRLSGLALVDIAPTVLEHFGLPVPRDMIGHVIDAAAPGTTGTTHAMAGSAC